MGKARKELPLNDEHVRQQQQQKKTSEKRREEGRVCASHHDDVILASYSTATLPSSFVAGKADSQKCVFAVCVSSQGGGEGESTKTNKTNK